MRLNERSGSVSGFFSLATFVLVVVILRSGEEVLVPVTIASILAFLLTPVVIRLTRLGLPKPLSVGLTSIAAFAIITTIGWVITNQAVNLFQQLPNYEKNIEAKVESLRPPHVPLAYARVEAMGDRIKKSLVAVPPSSESATEPAVSVQLQPTNRSILEVLQELIEPLLGPLGRAGIIVLFIVGILLQRDDIRNRFIKIVSPARLNLANQAVTDATQKVYRYLAMQLAINSVYGVFVGISLFLIGIPNPALWGLLAMLLRFIPFLGPWIAAACPIILAVAVDPGWGKVLETMGMYMVLELVTANVVESWLYGVTTGLSNLALMIAAVFWTWLWGTAGLFLSTPLTVCLVVIGKHVPRFNFFSVLLGSDPVLEPPAQFYHRMLAMDSKGMLDAGSKFVQERSLPEFYNNVFIPALMMAEEDRHAGALAEIRQTFILESARELIQELERRTPPGNGPVPVGAPVVLTVPAHDDADELAGLMLRHLLRDRGIMSEVSSIASFWSDNIEQTLRNGIQVVCVSALPPDALEPARFGTRRLKDKCPELAIIVGVWGARVGEIKDRLRHSHCDGIVTSLTDAVALLEKMVGQSRSQPPVPDPRPEPRTTGLDLKKLRPEERFDALCRDLAQRFQVPVAFVSVTDTDADFWKRHSPHRSAASPTTDGSKAAAYYEHGLQADELLVVEDITKDTRYSGSAVLKERGICFYAFMPLRTSAGRTVGNICAVDTKPRQISEQDRNFLHACAIELMEVVEAEDIPAPSSPSAAPFESKAS